MLQHTIYLTPFFTTWRNTPNYKYQTRYYDDRHNEYCFHYLLSFLLFTNNNPDIKVVTEAITPNP